jgi:hypothetical protein
MLLRRDKQSGAVLWNNELFIVSETGKETTWLPIHPIFGLVNIVIMG